MKRINPNLSELSDPYEARLADLRGLVWTSGKSFTEIANSATPPLSPATISKFAYGETARPQDRTIEAIFTALGLKQVVVPIGIAVAAEVESKPVWPADMLKRRKAARLKRQGKWVKGSREGRKSSSHRGIKRRSR